MTFDYIEPSDLEEALATIAEDPFETLPLAGGTAFIVLWGQGLIRPRRVVGLRRVAALHGIRKEEASIWIGGFTRHREVERSAIVREAQPALAFTYARVATVRIRNQATVGGGLAHADPAQDPPPTLIVLNASVEVAARGGVRRVLPVEDLSVDHLQTSLEPGELIVGVRVPNRDPATVVATTKFLPRTADDYATVAVAVAARRGNDGRLASLRIALGGVAGVPVRARAVEAALEGTRPTSAEIEEAAALVRDEVDPLADGRGSVAYKREMSRVWVERTIREAVA